MQEFIKKHDLINKLIALLIAVFLWSIVMNIKNPIISVSYNDILVDFTSLDLIEDTYDLVIISEQFPKVDVKLKGSRDDFSQITISNIDISADLSFINEPGEYQVDYNVKLPFSEMEVTSKYPDKLTVIIDAVETKQIPVIVELTGEPASNYSFNEIDVASTITVSGPSNEISKVVSAYATIDVSEATQDINGEYNFVLLDQYDAEIVSENIIQSRKTLDINLPILYTTNVPLYVDLVYGDIVNPKRIEGYTIENPYVSIIGKPEYVNAINSIYLGEIAIDDTQYGKSEFIFGLPFIENISYTAGTSSTVSVSIDFTDYTTGTFLVENFIYDEELFSDDMIIVNPYIEVLLSGSNADLATLENEDLSINVDIIRDIIEEYDEEGHVTEVYAPLEPGLYEFEATLNIVSLHDFDFVSDYIVIIEVIAETVEEE